MKNLVNIDLPVLHFSRALLRRSEHLEKRLALLDALLSVGVRGMGHLLHELEVGPHAVSESSHLAELGNEHDLCSSLLVNANNHWLVHVAQLRLILALEILVIGCFCTVRIQYERVLRRDLKVNVVDLVRALVVRCEDSNADERLFYFGSQVAAASVLDI